MAKGWIKLHRQITDHWIWEEKPFDRRSAWIDLLLMANHEEKKIALGNEILFVEKGCLITTEMKLADRWGWSKSKVRGFLATLEKDGMISQKKDRKKTAINIENYGFFQSVETTKESQKDYKRTAKEPQKNCERTAEEPQKDTNKNEEELKNEKELKNKRECIGDKPPRTRTFVPPTLENVRGYCQERGNSVDAERFVDYYTANGWMVGKNKMKDWKAAVRNWERQERKGEGYGNGNGKDQGTSGSGKWDKYNGLVL